MRMAAKGSQGVGSIVEAADRVLRATKRWPRCKRLSRLKARFPDQLCAIGALSLEVLREVLRRVENRVDPD
jgi:hypothetical protein